MQNKNSVGPVTGQHIELGQPLDGPGSFEQAITGYGPMIDERNKRRAHEEWMVNELKKLTSNPNIDDATLNSQAEMMWRDSNLPMGQKARVAGLAGLGFIDGPNGIMLTRKGGPQGQGGYVREPGSAVAPGYNNANPPVLTQPGRVPPQMPQAPTGPARRY